MAYQRILFIKPSSLGDIVHATAALAAVRRQFPTAYIAWLVKRQWAEIVERVEGVDEVLAIDSGATGWLRMIPRLRAAGFDLAIDLQGLFRSGVVAWLAGCPMRIGFASAREGSPWFYTHRVPVPTPEMHAVDRYLLVAAELHGTHAQGRSTDPFPGFPLKPRPADGARVRDLLARQGLRAGDPWIAVNVAARWPTKQWPPRYFAEVLDRLQTSDVGIPVLIGGSADLAQAAQVQTLARRPLKSLIGETTPGLLPALLSSAAVLLTNDSGPMHIAAAVGTPVVALFGPTSPQRTGPYGPGHLVLRNPVPCSPCFSRTCRNPLALECLVGLAPQVVYESVRETALRTSGPDHIVVPVPQGGLRS